MSACPVRVIRVISPMSEFVPLSQRPATSGHREKSLVGHKPVSMYGFVKLGAWYGTAA